MLREIPNYHLMAFSLNKDGYNELEQIYRNFLWGSRESGQPKIALVAWDTMTQPVLDGDLGIMHFQKMLGC